MDEEVRETLWREVENAFRLSEMLHGSYDFKLTKGYPSLYNNETVNGWMRDVARDLAGDEMVEMREFGMGPRISPTWRRRRPGAMFNLGAATPDGIVRNHHTSIFDIDESVLPVGAAVLAETARRFVTGRFTVDAK
jgi:metal-dependent amidase/aminoacylase/carboxypeptidase family protein